jgi:glycosyltransferase involved in cell wall biosynthesis
VVTLIPSPYQVEFFNALSSSGLGLAVAYVQKFDPSRRWEMPVIDHTHCFLEDAPSGADEWIRNSDFVVFSCYRQAIAQRLINLRHNSKRPWAFWGERPGVYLRGWLGRCCRAWAHKNIRNARAPIWGVGEWGVEGYRREFGDKHRYLNVSYFSNLDRFFTIERTFPRRRPVRFLFSGSLIFRKGVDILASAFRALLREGIDAELHFFGSGPLERTIANQSGYFAEKVHMHGFRRWNQLVDAYAQGDVLCAPSRYDGWGLVVPEALAAGMPVITTDRTGSGRELITSANGWVVSAGDRNALVTAMKRATNLNHSEQVAMSYMARQAALAKNLSSGVNVFTKAILLSIEVWPQPSN